MTLSEALQDCQRSKIFILAIIARDLPSKLEYIRNLYGDKPMKELIK
jgi:hypothetical protein